MTARVQSRTPLDRFWSQVEKTPECWLWVGYIKPNGYASFYPGGGRHVQKVYVHRFAYEATKGRIPEGLEIDHLCRVRHCVNPAHLEAVTKTVNLERRDALMTHCKHGHPFDEDNIYWWGGHRHCRACRTRRNRESAR